MVDSSNPKEFIPQPTAKDWRFCSANQECDHHQMITKQICSGPYCTMPELIKRIVQKSNAQTSEDRKPDLNWKILCNVLRDGLVSTASSGWSDVPLPFLRIHRKNLSYRNLVSLAVYDNMDFLYTNSATKKRKKRSRSWYATQHSNRFTSWSDTVLTPGPPSDQFSLFRLCSNYFSLLCSTMFYIANFVVKDRNTIELTLHVHMAFQKKRTSTPSATPHLHRATACYEALRFGVPFHGEPGLEISEHFKRCQRVNRLT